MAYILCCVRIATAPWRYWQLNARYFSTRQRTFSKLELDDLIPKRWRLTQTLDSDNLYPLVFPVFLKPEWGQNGKGIHRADNQTELSKLRGKLKAQPQRYLLQEAAQETREFEIFSIDIDKSDGHHDILTITETVNTSERFPINSIFNQRSTYQDITEQFSSAQRETLAGYLSDIGQFSISRLSVRANSIEDLIAGNFHVIEVNLFFPMPINLMDKRFSFKQNLAFTWNAMMCLARATKAIPPARNEHPIFTDMMLYGRRHLNKPRPGPSVVAKPKISEFGERSSHP